MANYFMLGGDGKEYGPIPADQLRQWAAEGRANATTQVRPAEGGAWSAFSAVPELSGPGFAASGPSLDQLTSAIRRTDLSSGPEDTVKRLASVLASGSGWMKFIAVLLFIGSGMELLVSFGIAIIVVWLPIWLGIILWGAATRASQAAYSGSEADLSAALDKLRFFFKLYGIVIIIGFVLGLLGALFFFAAVGTGLSGLQNTGGIHLGR